MNWELISIGMAFGGSLAGLFLAGFGLGRLAERRESQRLWRAQQGVDPWAKPGSGFPDSDETT
jgi:hypothetical protein